jgi:tetratricopeptide (TPR) repeat protein
VRALLISILDAMSSKSCTGPAAVAPRLMAYARALQFEAKWSLAADVYETVISHSNAETDPDLVISAHMALGACLRVLAQWDEATRAYAVAGLVAEGMGDVMGVLKARIAEANLAMARGNLPSAERLLDSTISSAGTSTELAQVRAIALQDRGIVARQRGDFDRAINLTYAALQSFEDQVAKDRALADLAAIFYDIGLLSAAREANLMLAATAQEQYTRWVAVINLLEIAAFDGREPVFEQYKRELGEANLPPILSAYYNFYVGQGYRMLGKFDQARPALERAIDVASRHDVNEVIIKAEQSLLEIAKGDKLAAKAENVSPSDDVAKVADAVREMRALAGVAD